MDNSILSEPFENVWYCKQINKCKSLKRIKCVLHYYQFIQNENKSDNDQQELAKQLMEYLENNKYENLINDYHHMLDKHLNQNDDDYKKINSTVSTLISCKIANCKFYLRNQRDREKEQKQNEINDPKSAFYIDILDNIHTYFVHGYDTGFRTKINYINDDEKEEEDENDNDGDDLFHDARMINLRENLQKKRENLELIRGENRMKHNKFSTAITKNIKTNNEALKSQFMTMANVFDNIEDIDQGLSFLDLLYENLKQENMKNHELKSLQTYIYQNEYDSDGIADDAANENVNNSNIGNFLKSKKIEKYFDIIGGKTINYKMNNDKNKNKDKDADKKNTFYSFGARYYYWDFYKNNNDHDVIHNPGYKYCDWYINKRFNNLKEEILQKLPIYEYNLSKSKAMAFCDNSETVNEIKSRVDTDAYGGMLHYDISSGEPITYKHLMSVIFYTDYSELSFSFSSTWRKRTAKETNQEMKGRNSYFWHWSKLLMETVHLFGNRYNYKSWQNPEPQIKTLYHGVSMMYFASFVTRFCSPTSMTRQFSVAAMFANEGIILDIQQCGGYFSNHPFYFNCSFLSCYAHEDERLFIGGTGFCGSWSVGSIPDGGLLQLSSIRILETAENYKWYIRALSLLHTIINGGEVVNFKNEFKKNESFYFKIIDILISDNKEKIDNMPEYIIQCFKKMTLETKKIKIDLYYIATHYASFKKIFKFSMNKNCTNLLLFDNICNIFPECIQIESNMEGKVYNNISIPFINELIKILHKISNNNDKYKLKRVTLTKYKYAADANFDLISSLFDEENNKNSNWDWNIKQKIKNNDVAVLYIFNGEFEDDTQKKQIANNSNNKNIDKDVSVTKEDVFNITESEKQRLENIKKAKQNYTKKENEKDDEDEDEEKEEEDISEKVIVNKAMFINIESQQCLLANNDFRLYNGHPLQTAKSNFYGLAEFALIPYDENKNYVNIFHVKRKRFVICINDHVPHEFYSNFEKINGVPIICGNKYKNNGDIDDSAIWQQIKCNDDYDEQCYMFKNIKSNRYITATSERAPNGYQGYKVIGVTENHKSEGSKWSLYQWEDKDAKSKLTDGRD